MGLFSGLRNAVGKLDLKRIGQGALNVRGLLSDDEEMRQRTMMAMMQQRQQQPQQPAQPGFGAVLPSHGARPAPQEIEMMRQGRSQGWHGGYNPPWVLSLNGGGIF